MPAPDRYEILNLIGNGDFAAVYRARDRELGRDVAIKQIHNQYLTDQRRLERFWREAQLLASLQHPHILTIYDVVRPRGWLVLELMQKTLLDASRGQPIDLSLLRSALVGSLDALSLLHANNVIHGDIKPSNLLLDKHGRVKLGDFGLARRVASDQGSYLKGATRYMAPELVAPHFGPISPKSDLYSLGFAAYELLCGSAQFEQLFPGLDAFGRDRQIAWMMWHAAPDRKLPSVASVLDGVPTDLARVIDRLTIKDPTQRYQSAQQALADLNRPAVGGSTPPDPADEQAAGRESRQKFQRRLVAGLALVASLLVSALIVVLPGGGAKPPPSRDAVMLRGVVRTLLPERQTLVIEQTGNLGPKELVVRDSDHVFLNKKASLLRELRESDQVTIQTLYNDQGVPVLEVHAARPEEHQGTIAAVNADDGALTITPAGGGEKLRIAVGHETPITINALASHGTKAYHLDDLRPGDRVTVQHFLDADRQTALRITAQRVVAASGVIRAIDLPRGEISIAAGPEQSASVTAWKLAERPEVTLNGLRVLNDRLLTPADLKPGDRVNYQHDVKLVSIAAQRQFAHEGTIQAIRYDVRSLTLTSPGSGERTFVLAPNCPVTLGGTTVTFDDLRRGDTLGVTFDDASSVSPALTTITAQRPPDPRKWAVLIFCATFDDSTVPAFPAATTESARLQQTLSARYAVPPGQVIVLSDPSRVRLEQGLPDALAKVSKENQLLVVIAGRAAADGKSPPLLVPKDFSRLRAADTGVPLASLLNEVEKCPAGQKIAFLDLAPIVLMADAAAGSAAAQVDAIRGTRSRPLLKTTAVFATSVTGNHESTAPAGLVAALAAGLAGPADPNRDNDCTVAELHDYLQSAGATNPPPRLILPETTPPRLTDDAKEAIRRIAASVTKQKIDPAEARALITAAEQLAPKEPEPKLLGGILLLKAREHAEALSYLEAAVAQNPKLPIAWEVRAWAHFDKLNYSGGINDLALLIRNLPAGPLPESLRRAIPWVGRLREFSASVAAPDRRPAAAAIEALDAAVVARGPDVIKLYQQGHSDVKKVIAEFDRQIASADSTEQLRLKFDRLSVRHYASFSLEAAAQQALATLEAD